MEFCEIVSKIESHRAILQADLSMIEVIDYGAGQPNNKRSKEEMQKGVRVCVSVAEFARIGVKEQKAKCIYEILRSCKARVILELGTCVGLSSAYFSFFAPQARIYTLEGSESLAALARKNHKHLGCENIEVLEGRFDLLLPSLLPQIAPLDFVFIDGHHDKEATLEYFHQIAPFCAKGSVMLFDDIAWSEGMKEAWACILQSKAFFKSKDYVWGGGIWL